jgi:hypothetical protein
MNSNINKIVLLVGLIAGCAGYSQKEEDISNEPVGGWEQDDHFGIIRAGLYLPIAVGENFANKALTQQPGYEFSFLVNLFDSPVLIGLNYNHFHSEVEKPQITGNYTDSDINSFGPVIGYQFLNDRHWRAMATLNYSSVIYKNYGENFDFKDSGGSLQIASGLGYQFTKHIGAYGELGFRRDFLRIESPSQNQDFFKGATYFTVGVGVRLII